MHCINKMMAIGFPVISALSGLVVADGAQDDARVSRPAYEAIRACLGQSAGAACDLQGGALQGGSGQCLAVMSRRGELLACRPAADGPAASYAIVDSGQSGCFSDFGAVMECPPESAYLHGQDAQHQGRAPSYLVNLYPLTGEATVTDRVTGLTWQQSPDTNQDGWIDLADELTYSQAVAHCENLVFAGASDWRLPDIKTLYSLIDFNGVDPHAEWTDSSGLVPFIDDGVFAFAYGDVGAGERIIDAQFASSTLYVSEFANRGATLFGVNFADGRIKGYGLSMGGREKTFSVLCVRGNAGYGQNDFIDQGDGTIVDRATGLQWSQTDSGDYAPGGLNWPEALSWVQARNAEGYLGYRDWRLPNAKELQSLVDYSRAPDTSNSAAIDPLFQVTPIINEAGQLDYPAFWTSTTHASWIDPPGAAAAYVTFGRGLGFMNGHWVDVHGAGAQRSDPKLGDPADYPFGHGPQGDAIRIYNAVRLVRAVDPQL